MGNDHLEDALLFLHSALETLVDRGTCSQWEIERAIEEIERHRIEVGEDHARP